ncbi:GAF domain-containing protein [Amycolatopsis japonica]|uniref:sensor histidine kinase n=1 Tax=Amycolatopsis japonica TaxID=208439 RepID=UPI003790230D
MVSRTSLPGLLEAVARIGGDLTLPDVLQRIARAAVDLFGARYGALALLGPDRALTGFVPAGFPATGVLPELPERSPVRLLLDEAGPVRLDEPPADPASIGFPADTGPVGSFLGVQIRVRERVFAVLYLTGGDFSGQDDEVLVALAGAAAAAIENAGRFEQVRRRGRWLEASYQITGALLAERDLLSTLGLIAERARVVAGGSVGAIARPGEDGLRFEIVEPRGEDADRLAGLTVPADNGSATGMAYSTGEAVVVRDYGERVIEQQGGRAGTLPAMLKDLDSMVAVPLVVGDDRLGVLVVAKFRDKTPFTETDVQLAETFAAHAALAVEFARAQEDRQRLAVFEERDRIARDLHDVVIQRLFATGLGLEGVGRIIGEPRIAERISGFVQDLDRTIREIRNSIFSLQEPTQAQGSLRSELLRIALDSAVLLGFEPRIGFDGPIDTAVPDEVRSDLLATLREALSNAARHAAASSVMVDVIVDRSGRRLAVTVVDDGVGPPDGPGRRSGLANLAERAARWGGSCGLKAVEDGGTRLEWTAELPGGTGGERGSGR